MYLGTQNVVRDEEFQVLAQLGVRHVSADPAGNPHSWTLDILERHRERVESFGLTLDMVQLPPPLVGIPQSLQRFLRAQVCTGLWPPYRMAQTRPGRAHRP